MTNITVHAPESTLDTDGISAAEFAQVLSQPVDGSATRTDTFFRIATGVIVDVLGAGFTYDEVTGRALETGTIASILIRDSAGRPLIELAALNLGFAQLIAFANDGENGEQAFRSFIFAGNDRIVGGDSGVYRGGLGNDTLIGGDGASRLDGGIGDDSMIGGLGDSEYVVSSVRDRVREERDGGVDHVFTELSTYRLGANIENLTYTATASVNFTGNALDNFIAVGEAVDSLLRGGAGNDTLEGGLANDTLDGGSGDDSLQGFFGRDRLVGGAGGDTLNGHDESTPASDIDMADTLVGGSGGDLYLADSADLIVETSGGGVDTVLYIGREGTYRLGQNLENLVAGNAVAQQFAGNLLDNLIVGGAGADSVNGDAGNDTIVGGDGADSLDGGAGRNRFVIGALSEVGDLILGFRGGSDEIDVTALVRAGLDPAGFAFVEIPADPVAGTPIRYELRHDDGAGNVLAILQVQTQGNGNGNGNGPSRAPDLDDLVVGARNFLGTSAAERVVGTSLAESIDGGSGNDYLQGGLGGGDSLFGGSGNDSIFGELAFVGSSVGVLGVSIDGGAGHDSIVGTDAVDTLLGGLGNDTIFAFGGGDSVNGGGGNDRITGSDSADTVLGESGNDRIFAEGGADTVNGGLGHDQVLGGAGDDTLLGELGNDTLWGDAGEDLLHGEAGNDRLFGGDGGDSLEGGAGNGTLHGGAGSDNLDGGLGNDRLMGGLDADILVGGAGRDSLDGGGGSDRLSGGLGADSLRGGAGADIFSYASSLEGGDRIADFTRGEDRLDIAELLSGVGIAGNFQALIDGGYLSFGTASRGTATLVRFDINGAAVSGGSFLLATLNGTGGAALTGDDFILSAT